MSRWEAELVDPFLADLLAEAAEQDVEEMVSAIERELAEVAPAPSLRDALLSAARTEGRFDRFAPVVAQLLDVSEARARELLDGIDRDEVWVDAPMPDVRLYHLEGGPAVAGAITGFVRMPQGAVFPEHEHLGDEAVLVVQGSFEDGVSGQVYRAGDLVRMAAGSSHHFRVRPGPALVYLVVLAEGLRIGEAVIGPYDPGM